MIWNMVGYPQKLQIKCLLNIFKKIRKWDFLYYGNFQEMGGRVLVYWLYWTQILLNLKSIWLQRKLRCSVQCRYFDSSILTSILQTAAIYTWSIEFFPFCHFVFRYINFRLHLRPGNLRWKRMKKTKKIVNYLRFQQIPLFFLYLEYPERYPWNPHVPIFQGRTLGPTSFYSKN